MEPGFEFGFFIKKSVTTAKSYISSCAFLREKPYAEASGMGYYGNNGLIIAGELGSLIAIGTLITTVELQEDRPLDLDCGKCRACLKSCPTGALLSPGVIDTQKCLQYL